MALSEKLASLTQSLRKAFYASDGSCAVEIAMKMSLHAHQIKGEKNKTQFIALKNAYHGETLGALSVSDVDLYRLPYEPALFKTHFISPLPYVAHIHEPLWANCDSYWERIKHQLDAHLETTTAIIIEPIVQAAGGMKIYSQDLLRRLRAWTQQHHIHLIADEIMTGLGRTGKLFACEYATIEPDFLCLSKGLTGGWLPMSVVMTRDDIYELFYDDYARRKSFLHSHTYSGNALAASIALQVLTILEENNICEQANVLGRVMLDNMTSIANKTGHLTNVRGIGAIVAADLITDNTQDRMGYKVYQQAVKRGALLRPLGNTIYWLPPLTTEMETIRELKEITEEAISAVF